MSALFIVGAVIYILAKKMDVYTIRGSTASKTVDEYVRDDTEQDTQLYPVDHQKTDHLMKAFTGPQIWLAGPQFDDQHEEFLNYGAEGHGPLASNKKVPDDLTLFSAKDEANLMGVKAPPNRKKIWGMLF